MRGATLVGGTSAVNAALAFRGPPADAAVWAARGVRCWSWEQVLPWCLRLEDDRGFRHDLHGAAGALPVRR